MCWRSFISWFFRMEKPDCPKEYITELTKTTVLTSGQIRHLYKRFYLIGNFKYHSVKNCLKKRDFLHTGHLSRNPILSIIMHSMFGERNCIDFKDFVQYLSTFEANYLHTKKEQIEATKRKKMKMLFDMYDRNKDGRIGRHDLIIIVHRLYGDVLKRTKVDKIADIMMHEMGCTEMDYVLYDEFCEALSVFDMSECLVVRIPED